MRMNLSRGATIFPPLTYKWGRTMGSYELTWITENLAAGHAPFSFDDLAAIKDQGIDAIINLCGEYCDLHEIQEDSGFSVYYLPIADECAPDMDAMQEALAWLEARLTVAIRCWSTADSALADRYLCQCLFDENRDESESR